MSAKRSHTLESARRKAGETERASRDNKDNVTEAAVTAAAEARSFGGVLLRVLELAQSAALERVEPPKTVVADRKPSSAAQATDDRSTALNALKVLIRGLDARTKAKLRTLMYAGRDGRDLAETRMAMTQRGDGAMPAQDDDFGLPPLEDLKRGHAIACATMFDLELEIGKWPTPDARRSLDERVWLRFGRELAMSEPEQWRCLGTFGPNKRLERLYLRRGEAAWWSFDALPDRPSPTVVQRRRSAKNGARGSALVPIGFATIAEHTLRTDRRALRRAVLAVRARLGSPMHRAAG